MASERVDRVAKCCKSWKMIKMITFSRITPDFVTSVTSPPVYLGFP
jgi:hypothetical protein